MLEDEPVTDPLAEEVSAIFWTVIASLPLPDELDPESTGLSCVIGAVLGPNCCDSETRNGRAITPEPSR